MSVWLKQHILVATDLEEGAAELVAWGASIARALGGRVTLLHVDSTAEAGFHDAAEVAAWMLEVQGERRERLEASAREATATWGVPFTPRLAQGEAAATILRCAEEEGVGLIVAARRSRGLLSRLLMGSTTRRLVRHSPRPLLVVEPGSGAPRLDTALVTTDYSEESVRGEARAREFCEAVGASLTVLNVFEWPTYVPPAPGYMTHTVSPSALEGLRGFYVEALASAQASAAARGVVVTVDAEAGHGVLRYAEEASVGLVIVPTHGKGALRAALLGSVSERVVEGASRPVLVLPRASLGGAPT